jgi:hypothetical protein
MNINDRLNERVKDLDKLLYGWTEKDAEDLDEYGLSFYYCKSGKEHYWRYLLSTGGPTEDFRFFINPDKSIHRVEFGSSYNENGTYETIEITDRESVIWDLAYTHFDISERDIP